MTIMKGNSDFNVSKTSSADGKVRKRKHVNSSKSVQDNLIDSKESEDSTNVSKKHLLRKKQNSEVHKHKTISIGFKIEDITVNPQKSKKKKKKKVSNQRDEESVKGNALAYLKLWSSDRQTWKFEKLKQIWLINNMFDTMKVPSDCFSIFLEYIEGSQGNARKSVVSKAMAIIQEMERWSESTEDEQALTKKPDEDACNRARELLQFVHE